MRFSGDLDGCAIGQATQRSLVDASAPLLQAPIRAEKLQTFEQIDRGPRWTTCSCTACANRTSAPNKFGKPAASIPSGCIAGCNDQNREGK
jgi:hypothetical protein